MCMLDCWKCTFILSNFQYIDPSLVRVEGVETMMLLLDKSFICLEDVFENRTEQDGLGLKSIQFSF